MHTNAYELPSDSDFVQLIGRLRARATSEPQAVIDALKRQEADTSTSAGTYADVRSAYLAVNIVLNECGLTAPAFRRFRAVRRATERDDNDTLLLIDRSVIDLHYLHCHHRGQAVRPTDVPIKQLFDSDTFDFGLAGAFGTQQWKAATKAAALRLPESVQVVVNTLREDAVASRWRRVEQAADRIHTRLVDLANAPRSRFKTTDIPIRLDELRCLKLAHSRPAEAAMLARHTRHYALYTGSNRTLAALLQKRAKWFDSVVGRG